MVKIHWNIEIGITSLRCYICSSTPHHQHKKVRSHHPCTAAATLVSVHQRVQFKIAVLVHKALDDLLPAYLAEDCQLVSVNGRRQLRSSDINTCLAQWTNTHLGDHSFPAAGPQVRNSLPTQLRESDITPRQFRQALKMHLFGYWQLQCKVTVFFRELCTDWLICLLTY